MTDKPIEKLLSYWRTCPVDHPPYIPSGDRQSLSSIGQMTYETFDSYVQSKSFGAKAETAFHYGLLPIPFVGDLLSAKVFILLLNPGLSHGDYYAEYQSNKFREAHIRNLYQDNKKSSYPFHFLDPTFAWHPGFVYWQSKFDDLLQHIASEKGISYQESLRFLSKRVACLELYGYHSKTYKGISKRKMLPSTKLMLDYVQQDLILRARNGQISIIVTRGKSEWGVLSEERQPNIILYDGTEARAAYLTKHSRGRAEIVKRIIKS